MNRVLVLEHAQLAIVGEAIEAIELVEPDDEAHAWLPALARDDADARSESRRRLRLHGGGRVEVPAAMRIAERVEVLELPELLREIGKSRGLVGLARLPEGLTLVCDPRMLAGLGGEG